MDKIEPILIYQCFFIFKNKHSSTEIKLKQHDAQKQTSLVQSSNNFAAVAPGLISTLLVGYISDRFGRKIALGILIAGEAAQVVAVGMLFL